METELDCTRYGNFVEQLKSAYRRTGFMFEPGIWYDDEIKQAHPVAILAIDREGLERFMSMMGQFFNVKSVIKWLDTEYLHGNWLWARGFLAAIDKEEKQPWKGNESSDAGWRVGREVRKRLLEWNRERNKLLKSVLPLSK